MLKQFTAAACAAILLLGGCSDSKKHEDADTNALIAKTVYTLNGIDGSKFEVTKEGTDFITKGTQEAVIVYDIFATWCPPCRAEAPHLSKLQKKFKGKVRFIGVSIEEGNSNAYYQKFATDIGIDYTIVNSPDNQRFARAVAGTVGLGQDFPIPLMVIYKNGHLVKYYSGLVPEEMIESDLKQLTGA
jgi:thiol-disulfide isomerase/thioredoxin